MSDAIIHAVRRFNVKGAEMAISDLSYGVQSVRRSTFTPDQIERLKALRDDLTTIIEREER